MVNWVPKEKRVEDIVNAAIEIFIKNGYDGTSIDSIAKKANISKGGLYHHFKNKEEILYYANEKICQPTYEFINEAINKEDVVEGLKYYIRNYLLYWLDHRKEMAFIFLTMTKALNSPQMWDVYSEYYKQLETFLFNLYEKGIASEKFIKHDAKTNVIALISSLDGVLPNLVMNKGLNPDDVIKGFEEKFILSLLKR